MSSRCWGPGWRLAAMNDSTGRRGIWYRFDLTNPTSIEICGGREGDDFYVRFVVGQEVAKDTIESVRGILDTGAWMVDSQNDGGY